MRDTYLSVDLDFFVALGKTRGLELFADIMFQRSLGGIIVPAHHKILKDVNESGCTNLINIDYHSDFGDQEPGMPIPLNCGTWVNKVKWRNKGTYTWIYPHKSCTVKDAGACWVYRDPFKHKEYGSGWAKTRSRLYTSYKQIPWGRLKRIAFSASPDWILKHEYEKLIEPLAKHLKIPSSWYKYTRRRHVYEYNAGRLEARIKEIIRF